ncbi:class I SAM-dependent methyltransferase [Chryseomicrobium palamuruense]|uniref:Class I SAM-dependent methyltransferase n=1 Tax=Chryseomicrobium palamuruense TaxID=682973 RepID=A0ABV8UTK4_9BACL
MKAGVTTSAKLDEKGRQFAKQIALKEKLLYIERFNQPLHKLWGDFDVLYMWTTNGWYAETRDTSRHHFHPGTAMFRFKRWKLGEREPFLEATDLQAGDSFLDCTLGLGSDCLMASLQVGKLGKVTGIEKSPISAFLFRQSQFSTDLGESLLNEALHRIEFYEIDALTFLKGQKNNSVDVVYLDPMFEELIEESTNFRSHHIIASKDQLSAEWMNEAIRVAKKRVVLKAHFRSELFAHYSFKRLARKSAKFHFGYIEKNKLSR